MQEDELLYEDDDFESPIMPAEEISSILGYSFDLSEFTRVDYL